MAGTGCFHLALTVVNHQFQVVEGIAALPGLGNKLEGLRAGLGLAHNPCLIAGNQGVVGRHGMIDLYLIMDDGVATVDCFVGFGVLPRLGIAHPAWADKGIAGLDKYAGVKTLIDGDLVANVGIASAPGLVLFEIGAIDVIGDTGWRNKAVAPTDRIGLVNFANGQLDGDDRVASVGVADHIRVGA